MKLIDHILYIEFAELEACDISRRTILSWDNIKDPTDKRKVLIKYEALADKYQSSLVKKYGDPYTYVHNQVIKQFLKSDYKAQDFFFSFRTSERVALPLDYQAQYLKAANWLNLIIDIENNWAKCKKILCMESKPELYEAVIKIIDAEGIKLPATYQTLKRKIAEYKETGCSCIISKKFGNDNSKKVKDELNEALLVEMMSDQYDDTFVALKYNKVCDGYGWKRITAVTVGNYRHQFKAKIEGFRNGNASWYDYAGKTVHRARPSAPLMLINSDDNELDLYFIEERIVLKKVETKDGKEKRERKEINPYYRPVLYVVIDGFNDLILGYAIGDTATTDLVKEAYLNAANYVKQLTGDNYFWRQLQADHWNLKALTPFFEQQGNFTPAGAKNARAKIIEQSFNKKWHSKLKELFPRNYAGHNITAKAKVNRDAIEANKKFFPAKSEAPDHIEFFIEEMRNLVDPQTGKTKKEQWLEAWKCMQQSEKRLITQEQRLMWLGYEHRNQYTGVLQQNTITKEGLMPSINGLEYVYEIPKELYRDTLGLKVKIKYDPYDMSQILAVSSDERTRMVCSQFERVPMALADHKEGTRTHLNSLLTEKKGHVAANVEEREQRLNALKRAGINAESLMQAGVLTKEIKQSAQMQIEQKSGGDKRTLDIYELM